MPPCVSCSPTVRKSKQLSCFASSPCSSSVRTKTSSPTASHPQLLNVLPLEVTLVLTFSGLSIAPPDVPAMEKKWFG